MIDGDIPHMDRDHHLLDIPGEIGELKIDKLDPFCLDDLCCPFECSFIVCHISSLRLVLNLPYLNNDQSIDR